jgi:endonuclease/exonuclease/phosphatase family metal-dependent hydrolase
MSMCAFRVLQFNIQFGQNWSDADPDTAPVNLDLTIDEIRSHDADIILLQEVEQALPGGVQPEPPPNFLRLRAAFPGYDAFFSYPKADPRELPFGIGLAILSKTALSDQIRFNLPSPAVEFNFQGERKTPTDRLLIGAVTNIAGHRLQIFNTHLLAFFMLNSDSETHISQREFVAEQLRASTGPTVLGGDFNVSNHGSLIEQFDRIGYRTLQSSEITWRRRPYVLDHIFYNHHLQALGYLVKPTAASDHHVLRGDFEFI